MNNCAKTLLKICMCAYFIGAGQTLAVSGESKNHFINPSKFTVQIIRSGVDSDSLSNGYKVIKEFSGVSEITKNLHLEVGSPSGKLSKTYDKVRALTFKDAALDNAIEYSNGCHIKVKGSKALHATQITLVEYPVSDKIDFYYNYVEAGEKRIVELNDCIYHMPSVLTSASMSSFNLAYGQAYILNIGKINNHYIYIRIVRNRS